MKKSIHEIAVQLNGSEYGQKLLNGVELPEAVLVISGYSDDNVEVEGFIRDEVGAYKGAEFYILPQEKCLMTDDELTSIPDLLSQLSQGAIDLIERVIKEKIKNLPKVEAKRSHEGYSRHITVSGCEVAYFDVMEDGDKFCRGAVIDLSSFFKL